MKTTPADVELAKRFPVKPSTYGYGLSAADARCSPAQIDRLLKLELIKISSNGYCGGIHGQKPAKGWLRDVTTFIRTFK